MAATLLLDITTWDLCADTAGNIAVAAEPYALAQDAASAIRTFEGECWYDTTLGLPYWMQILGQAPPVALMKAAFVAAARTVPDVTAANCFITSIVGRVVRGQVQIRSASGDVSAASF